MDFTGKEKDYETGYHYFGARYMDHELMTMWLSVDPMTNKYPSISPYAYCAWTRPTGGDEHRWIKYNIVNNPVKLKDPHGDTISYGEEYVYNLLCEIDRRLTACISTVVYNELSQAKKDIKELMESDVNYYIVDHNITGLALQNNEKGFVMWMDNARNGQSGVLVVTDGDNLGVLIHELKHCTQFENGQLSFDKKSKGYGKLYDKTDEASVHWRQACFEQYTNYSIYSKFNPALYRLAQDDGTYVYMFYTDKELKRAPKGSTSEYRYSERNANHSFDLSNDYYRKK